MQTKTLDTGTLHVPAVHEQGLLRRRFAKYGCAGAGPEMPPTTPGGPGVEPGPEVTEPPGTAPGGLPQRPEIPHMPPQHEVPQPSAPGTHAAPGTAGECLLAACRPAAAYLSAALFACDPAPDCVSWCKFCKGAKPGCFRRGAACFWPGVGHAFYHEGLQLVMISLELSTTAIACCGGAAAESGPDRA